MSAPASGKPSPAASAAASAAAPASWDELLAAAKREGTVVIGGPPEQATRTQLPEMMKQRFGIEVQYLTQTSSQIAQRLATERAAGQYTLDLMLAGSDTAYTTLLGQGWADPLKPALVMPGVADPGSWKTGGPWFRDSQQQYVLQVFNSMQPIVTINTQLIPDTISTADQLLDPKYKGKIAAFDPTVNGIGVQVGAALYASKGEDFLKKLYVDQKVTFTQDYRQIADWAAHGNYPIAIGVAPAYLELYKQAGITFATPEMSDAHSAVQGGFGLVVLVNHAPHPNAARVLANFIASKDGLTMYSQTQQQVPVRSDIDPTWLPQSLIPQPGVAYYDGYDPQFLATRRAPVLDFFKKLLK
ncbi:MAG TPA: extracellular solute-binding protein [Chloroflexota bacterium]|nr:extracellular solute-binding protein [Chloroflexota bacterium]